MKSSSRHSSFVIGSFLAGWLFIVPTCWSSSELPSSNLPISPSPILSTSITATYVTPTSVPTSSPTPTPTVVTPQPTLTSTPPEVAIFPPPPTVTRVAKAEIDEERLNQILSEGAGYIRLWPQVADMLLTDAQGRRLGYDPVSGQDVNEFFNRETNFSGYFRNESIGENYHNLIALLPLQAWGSTITITITGIEAGEYNMSAMFVDSNHFDTPIYVYTGTIRPGEIVTKTIKVLKKP